MKASQGRALSRGRVYSQLQVDDDHDLVILTISLAPFEGTICARCVTDDMGWGLADL